MLKYRYDFEMVMTDNGAEFGSGKNAKNKDEHPFERLLTEMEMKHVYPYRPQTNGKIERFWKTLKEDFLECSLFNNEEDFKIIGIYNLLQRIQTALIIERKYSKQI